MNIAKLYDLLYRHYGPQGWWPIYDRWAGKCEYSQDFTQGIFQAKQRFEVCVGAILTQNTSWGNVEKTLGVLYEENAMHPEAMAAMELSALAELIRPSGYYNTKAKTLKAFCEFLLTLGPGAPSRQELLAQRGIGPETADSILLYAYGEPVFVCDAYTQRLMARLGYDEESLSYAALQKLFTDALMPVKKHIPFSVVIQWRELHALILRHCVWVCNKRPLCANCLLENECRHVAPAALNESR